MTGSPWLDAEEKDAWTGLISLVLLMPGRLEPPLQREHGLTLFEYLALSHTSEAPGRSIVMSDLAFLANGSLSRLSNVVKRCEARGWVERYADPDDRRRTVVHLTDVGYDVVAAAAPTHVAAVRRAVLDPLDAEDRSALVRIASRLHTTGPDGAVDGTVGGDPPT